MSRDGLTSAQLRKGGCYSLPGFIGEGYHVIRIESIGPKMVRYCGWGDDGWSKVKRHPRVLFNSWDGAWNEAEDPHAPDLEG